MKLLPTLSLLAGVAVSTAHAELTPFNATYDLFMADQLLTLGAATSVVVDTHDQWMLDTFQDVVVDFETSLAEATQPGSYYWDLLSLFFKAATTHDPSYKDLQTKVSSFDQPAMSYAPRAYSDATFAVFQALLPTAKNATATGWGDKSVTWQQLYDTERKEMEALIDSKDRDTIRITARMERLRQKLFVDDFLGRKYSHAWACLDKRMRDAFHGGAGVNPRLSCTDVPAI
jgi:hypothetical protein